MIIVIPRTAPDRIIDGEIAGAVDDPEGEEEEVATGGLVVDVCEAEVWVG